MSFVRRHKTTVMGAMGLGAGWILASVILDVFFGGSPLPWWFAAIVAAVYIGVGVFRGPPEERERGKR